MKLVKDEYMVITKILTLYIHLFGTFLKVLSFSYWLCSAHHIPALQCLYVTHIVDPVHTVNVCVLSNDDLKLVPHEEYYSCGRNPLP